MPGSLTLLALFALPALTQQANWTGPYQPCLNSAELKKTGHMRIGVRYDISDRFVTQQFHQAFDFWSRLLDAEFYDEQSPSCAIAVVEGSKALLKETNVVARAQFPDRPKFHGWVAVDSKASAYLSDSEAVAIWIHEIGHLLGLRHNPSAASLMFYIVYATNELDSADLRALASLHSFRPIPAIQYSTVDDYGPAKKSTPVRLYPNEPLPGK